MEKNEAFLKADFEYRKDINANFTYYIAFVEAIRADRRFDPNGDILAMVEEYASTFEIILQISACC